MSSVHVKTQRRFNPHLLLMRGAYHFLDRAAERRGGWYYEWLSAIVLSALFIEAIGNSYGEVLLPDWSAWTSQRRRSPVQKLERVAKSRRITPDFNKDPWLTIRKMKKFRDSIAHATRDRLVLEENRTLSDYHAIFYAQLESDLEKTVTEDFARESYDAVQQVVDLLNTTLTIKQRYELTCDGNESHAEFEPQPCVTPFSLSVSNRNSKTQEANGPRQEAKNRT